MIDPPSDADGSTEGGQEVMELGANPSDVYRGGSDRMKRDGVAGGGLLDKNTSRQILI
jgi:hypothetical protein